MAAAIRAEYPGPCPRISPADWRDLEFRARDAGIAQILQMEDTPLQPGDAVAWTETPLTLNASGHGGVGHPSTDRLSSIHRVGIPSGDTSDVDDTGTRIVRTRCGLAVPPPIRRLALSRNLIATHVRCGACEAAEEER